MTAVWQHLYRNADRPKPKYPCGNKVAGLMLSDRHDASPVFKPQIIRSHQSMITR
jgi:hypothetical protein